MSQKLVLLQVLFKGPSHYSLKKIKKGFEKLDQVEVLDIKVVSDIPVANSQTDITVVHGAPQAIVMGTPETAEVGKVIPPVVEVPAEKLLNAIENGKK